MGEHPRARRMGAREKRARENTAGTCARVHVLFPRSESCPIPWSRLRQNQPGYQRYARLVPTPPYPATPASSHGHAHTVPFRPRETTSTCRPGVTVSEFIHPVILEVNTQEDLKNFLRASALVLSPLAEQCRVSRYKFAGARREFCLQYYEHS